MTSLFETKEALDINHARLEHLKQHHFHLSGKTILDVGCGALGVFTKYFIESGANVSVLDLRQENLNEIQKNVKGIQETLCLDINKEKIPNQYDILFMYGTLYHLTELDFVLDTIFNSTNELFILESRITVDNEHEIEKQNILANNQGNTETCIIPSLSWLLPKLKKVFPYVYKSVIIPEHPDFRTDIETRNNRIVVFCSKQELDNQLIEELK